MLIKGIDNAISVARLIGLRLIGNSFTEKYKFSVIVGEFDHDSRDHWYFINFTFPRLRRCVQNLLEQEVCQENGFDYK